MHPNVCAGCDSHDKRSLPPHSPKPIPRVWWRLQPTTREPSPPSTGSSRPPTNSSSTATATGAARSPPPEDRHSRHPAAADAGLDRPAPDRHHRHVDAGGTPDPVPCHWRSGGPFTLADDSLSSSPNGCHSSRQLRAFDKPASVGGQGLLRGWTPISPALPADLGLITSLRAPQGTARSSTSGPGVHHARRASSPNAVCSRPVIARITTSWVTTSTR